MPTTDKEPSLSENARVILEKRYLKKDAEGRVIETPGGMFRRVARAVAEAERVFTADIPASSVAEIEAHFIDMMTSFRFIPNSPTLMNAGTPLGQLAACFVLPVDDSMESIFETLKHMAMIHKSGGGTGFSFSRIRPANDTVLSTAGVSSGPVSFISVYDAATDTVKQGGTRRGANMAILRVDHPDIEAFIEAKTDTGRLHNFNISVAVTDTFLQAAAQERPFPLVNPRNGETVANVDAKALFEKIVQAAWRTGEPGIVFIDRVNRDNPTPRLGDIEATNPCGEQPLLPYESCTLGSVNLAEMVTADGRLDETRLADTVKWAVRFLDNIIEINRYPLKRIEAATKQTRKIGLGVMGFADMLIKTGVSYDSDEAEAAAEDIMRRISKEARAASAALGKVRGNFPAYAGSRHDTPSTPNMRNAAVTTIAPTGTISIFAGATGGIEPIFAVTHKRTVLENTPFLETHPLFQQAAEAEGIFDESLAAEIAETGTLKENPGVSEKLRRLFITAHEVPVTRHVRIQAAFQRHTDNAVSKTVNFPQTAAPEDVEAAFRLAHETGCKGITIYRDGSRQDQVLQMGHRTAEAPPGPEIAPRPRPSRTHGFTERTKTGCGNLYVTVNFDENGLCEVFGKMGKTGGCASSQIEAAGRLISLALRSGVKVESIVKQLIGIRCPSPAWTEGTVTLSCPDAIAQVLKTVRKDPNAAAEPVSGTGGVCPDCGKALTHAEGCLICRDCGFSRCG